MPTGKVNAGDGWVPDLPDHRDKLFTAIAAPPRNCRQRWICVRAVHRWKTRGNSAVAPPTRWWATWNSLKKKAGSHGPTILVGCSFLQRTCDGRHHQ